MDKMTLATVGFARYGETLRDGDADRTTDSYGRLSHELSHDLDLTI